MSRRGRWARWRVGVAALGLAGAALLLAGRDGAGGAPAAAGPTPAPAGAATQPAPAPTAAPRPAGPPAEAGPAFAQWVAERSALRGSALDGDWGLDASGRLQPSRALRRRFDHLLQLQGQAPLDAIGGHLRWLAAQDLPAPQVDAVMQCWQRYLDLLQAPTHRAAQPAQPDTLGPALAEQQLLRRQWLGPAWAQAFYGEEEAALQDALIRANDPPAAPPPLIDREALDPAAQQRLAEEEAEQARWRQRLAQARAELARLQAAPELSPPQRRQAQARWLDEQFSAAEAPRVRALLGLPAPP